MKRVYCYRNLHKASWSMRQSGKVIGHPHEIFLRDVRFLVGKKGRERVLRERVKNVHAGISGYVCDPPTPLKELFRVTYDPYKYESFVSCEGDIPIYFAKYAMMDIKRGVFVCE